LLYKLPKDRDLSDLLIARVPRTDSGRIQQVLSIKE
jgi:hypothetical protein